MTIPLPVCRAAKLCECPIGAAILPIGILLASAVAVLGAEPHPTSLESRPRPLALAVDARIQREDVRKQSLFVPRVEGLVVPPARTPGLEFSGRSWPFALAAAADATTTYWALGRGAHERNPLLAAGRLDVVMVKLVQFPLLSKAIGAVEARHPRLGRHLRWVSLAFHAALAFHNLRMGRSASQLGLEGPPRTP
ncbi:MAG TPA: hypothetical protein VMR21_15760 [Vicinamibacteria bacterium]|nr:hypothetical protein [Vicinamibacteria bacterium]